MDNESMSITHHNQNFIYKLIPNVKKFLKITLQMSVTILSVVDAQWN